MHGVIFPFGGSTAPGGFLMCDGSAYSRTLYAALFAVIGTTFGAGDGSTTFNVPDMRGRVAAGVDNMGGTAASRLTSGGSGLNASTLGAVGGTETHTLTTAQMPAHTHANTLSDPGHVHSNTLSDPGHAHNTNSNYYNVSAQGSGTATPYNGGGQMVSGGAVIANTTGVTINNASKVTGVTITNASQGSGSAHNNVQPTLVLNYIIKT